MPTANVGYYSRILVTGARQVGKTTILTKAINGEYTHEYNVSRQAERFYDCSRRLEFIDTPGIEDRILDGSKKNFQNDPMVKSLLGDQKDDSINFLSGIDVNTIDAYIIVYTDCQRSRTMARALKRAIRDLENENLKKNPIIMVFNQSDVDRPPPPKLSEYMELVKYANLYRSSPLEEPEEERRRKADLDELQSRLKSKYLEYADNLEYIEKTFVTEEMTHEVVVRAKTGWGFRKLMQELLKELKHAPNANKRIVTGKNTAHSGNTTRTGCNVPSPCSLQ